MRTLYSISYSPWSECARWALEHHRVDCRRVEFLPLVAEVQLRIATGRFFARISAPTLVDGSAVLADSLDIARHAERIGQGSSLFPGGPNGDVVAWNDRAMRAMSAGRTRYFGRLEGDPNAVREHVPSFVPAPLREASIPVVEMTTAYLARKYRANDESSVQAQASLVEELEVLEASIQKGPYILGEFSYADIVMAAALHFVAPLPERHLRLGAATRDAMRDAPVAERFEKVIAWRDELYDRHRR
jgi:glutathione S-transferase